MTIGWRFRHRVSRPGWRSDLAPSGQGDPGREHHRELTARRL